MRKRLGDDDFNVADIELEHGVSAGITLRSLSEGTIPPYYEHQARIRANITMERWMEMSRWDKALTVAMAQTEKAIEGHQAEAEIKQAQRDANRNK